MAEPGVFFAVGIVKVAVRQGFVTMKFILPFDSALLVEYLMALLTTVVPVSVLILSMCVPTQSLLVNLTFDHVFPVTGTKY